MLRRAAAIDAAFRHASAFIDDVYAIDFFLRHFRFRHFSAAIRASLMPDTLMPSSFFASPPCCVSFSPEDFIIYADAMPLRYFLIIYLFSSFIC